ncbi:hypothetical protein O0235_03800 [Tepidiforma flava]|uniref:Uncharacterized protein n=1 Tax=Tepidiforma flava TaxID=3004094 RepID=A0ABY7M857_9CHLR|nr:hypothetical protein [Tepidiforma flava]WBL36689.1 hypothetical protein O0235_03800 [Tepidiforma flava]
MSEVTSARSSIACALIPSSPTVMPPWLATHFTFRPPRGCATDVRSWSKHRPGRKAAKLAMNAVFPQAASPAAMPTMFCSATPTVYHRSGYFSPNW